MADSVRPVPEGYHTATPYLICSGGAEAIDFYKRAFGAVELMRMPMPNGRLGHAGGTPVSVLLYVENVDAVFEQAVSSGAKAVRPPQDMFYGDRTSSLIDPFGHSWYIHTHVKDVSPEEMQSAMSANG